jgi:hypothetical protein
VGAEDSDKNWNSRTEIPNQVRFLREKGALGSVFFSSRSLKKNAHGLTDSLRNEFYRYPALIPTMPWIDNVPPSLPRNLRASINEEDQLELEWDPSDPAADRELPRYYVLYRFDANERPSDSDASKIVGISYEGTKIIDRTAVAGERYQYFVTAVDRLHNESRPAGPLKIRLQATDGE